jgi:hypothetical protein
MGRFIGLFVLIFIVLPTVVYFLTKFYAKFNEQRHLDKLDKQMQRARKSPGIERFEFLVKRKTITLDELADFRSLPKDMQKWHKEQAERAGDYALAMWCGPEFLDKV